MARSGWKIVGISVFSEDLMLQSVSLWLYPAFFPEIGSKTANFPGPEKLISDLSYSRFNRHTQNRQFTIRPEMPTAETLSQLCHRIVSRLCKILENFQIGGNDERVRLLTGNHRFFSDFLRFSPFSVSSLRNRS